jgi:hypothetical protein
MIYDNHQFHISSRGLMKQEEFLSYTSKLIVVDKILQLQLQIKTLKYFMNRKQKNLNKVVNFIFKDRI